MKSGILFAAIGLAAALSTASCSDNDGDTTPPVIILLAPEEGATLPIGDPGGIYFGMEISDNDMLGSYKVDIHENSDGHGHSRSEDTPTEPFSYQNTWDLSGSKNTTVHHHDIKIPANATPGAYHMVVYCTDASGNQAHLVRNITLSVVAGEENNR